MTPEHVADSQTNVINYWALKIQKNKIKTLIEEGPVTVGNSEGMKGKKKKKSQKLPTFAEAPESLL